MVSGDCSQRKGQISPKAAAPTAADEQPPDDDPGMTAALAAQRSSGKTQEPQPEPKRPRVRLPQPNLYVSGPDDEALRRALQHWILGSDASSGSAQGPNSGEEGAAAEVRSESVEDFSWFL